MYKLADDSDFRVLTVEPKIDQKTQVQAMTREEVPQWTITALYFPDEENPRPELVKVGYASHGKPEFTPMETGLENVYIGNFASEKGGQIVYFKAFGLVELEAA